MSHLDGIVSGVVVDQHRGGIVGGGLQDLLLEGAVSSLQQRHPVDSPGWRQEPGVRVTALPVHNCGGTGTQRYHGYLGYHGITAVTTTK